VRLDYLSKNLIILIQELLKNEKICKMVNYNVKNPFSEPSFKHSDLMLKKIFPFPFNLSVDIDEGTQVRVYYSDVLFKNNQVIEDTRIIFDVICSKSVDIWTINDGEMKIRPYEIIKEIVNQFNNKSIKTLGEVRFKTTKQVYINDRFDSVRLFADIYTIGK